MGLFLLIFSILNIKVKNIIGESLMILFIVLILAYNMNDYDLRIITLFRTRNRRYHRELIFIKYADMNYT